MDDFSNLVDEGCRRIAKEFRALTNVDDSARIAGEWSFPDAPLRGVFARNDAGITGWDSFEPWLSRIESFPESQLQSLVAQIPPEWYGSAVDELDRLLCKLLERRSLVRVLVLSFKNSSRNPFPNWRDGAS